MHKLQTIIYYELIALIIYNYSFNFILELYSFWPFEKWLIKNVD